MIALPPVDGLFYTDDTEMMLGIVETLVACGKIDLSVLCHRFGLNYHPERGYGQGFGRIRSISSTG